MPEVEVWLYNCVAGTMNLGSLMYWQSSTFSLKLHSHTSCEHRPCCAGRSSVQEHVWFHKLFGRQFFKTQNHEQVTGASYLWWRRSVPASRSASDASDWSVGWVHPAAEPCRRWPAAVTAAARRTGHPGMTVQRAWHLSAHRWSCREGDLEKKRNIYTELLHKWSQKHIMMKKNTLPRWLLGWAPVQTETEWCTVYYICLPMKTEKKKNVMGMFTIGADMFKNQLGVMGKNRKKSRKKKRQSLFSSTWERHEINKNTAIFIYIKAHLQVIIVNSCKTKSL